MVISEGLRKAVENKDIATARSSFYTIILSDPMFHTSKFDEALKYVKDQGFDNFMDVHDGEELKPEEEWTEEYFDILASKLQDNFSEERISQIKKVAEALGMSESRQPKEEQGTRGGTESRGKSSAYTAHGGKYDWLYALGGVLVVAALIRRLFKGGR